MNRQKNFLVMSVLSCAAILFGVAGCGGGDSESSAGPVKTQQEQIAEIQSNTHMPPSAKAAALAALQQGQASGQAAAQETKK